MSFEFIAIAGCLFFLAVIIGFLWYLFRKAPLWFRILGSLLILIQGLIKLNDDFHFFF